MSKPKNVGCVTRSGKWWTLRYRQRVSENGVVRTILKARRIAEVGPECKTKAAAREKANAAFAEQVFPARPVEPARNLLLREFVDSHYLPHVLRQRRPSTARSYVQMWRRYLEAEVASLWLREVETFHVQNLLEGIARQHGLSRRTIGHIKHFLSGVFRHAAQQGYSDGRNPVTLAEIPESAPKGKEGEAYTFAEIVGMLKLLGGVEAMVVAVAACTGLRQGEICGLCWEDYSPAPDENSLGTVTVARSIWHGRIGEPKTPRSKAPVPVIPELADRLAAFRVACGNPVSGPMFDNGEGRARDLEALARRALKPKFEKAGIRWKGFHGFRRGLASNLNRLGVDDSTIQAILRHSNVSVTQTCYIKTTRPETIDAMRVFSDEFTRIRSSVVLQDEPKPVSERVQ